MGVETEEERNQTKKKREIGRRKREKSKEEKGIDERQKRGWEIEGRIVCEEKERERKDNIHVGINYHNNYM